MKKQFSPTSPYELYLGYTQNKVEFLEWLTQCKGFTAITAFLNLRNYLMHATDGDDVKKPQLQELDDCVLSHALPFCQKHNWRKLTSKWGSACAVCGHKVSIGTDIMWCKINSHSQSCHLECFALVNDPEDWPTDLRTEAVSVICARLKKAEEEIELWRKRVDALLDV